MPKPIPAEVNKAIAPLIGISSISSNKPAAEGEFGCAITIEAKATNKIKSGIVFKSLLTWYLCLISVQINGK